MTQRLCPQRYFTLLSPPHLARLVAIGISFCGPANLASADESGVSFWSPGFFGSLAATPQPPGWSLTAIYYHTDISATGNTALSQITTRQFNSALNINADFHERGDIGFLIPQYVLGTPLLNGQAAIAVAGLYGHNQASLNATSIPISQTVALTDMALGFSDLIPEFSLRWNAGADNLMTYITGDVPIGAYNPSDLANLGIGHSALDGGLGYTYFDPKTGHEFSIVSGLTGNFTNPRTGYTNGIDWHTDWAASQFITKQLQIGVVGYFYDQLSPDRGATPVFGNFESRVAGIGPQIGYLFPIGNLQGYLNLKAYWEFAAQNRPEGWNAWVTFAVSPATSAQAGAMDRY